MTEWIVRKHDELVESFAVDYQERLHPGSGYGFTCDKAGNIDRAGMDPAGLENLAKCEDGTYDVVCLGVVDHSYIYPVNAQLRCECGQPVELEPRVSRNGCEGCGREYNLFGQLLARRPRRGDDW